MNKDILIKMIKDVAEIKKKLLKDNIGEEDWDDESYLLSDKEKENARKFRSDKK